MSWLGKSAVVHLEHRSAAPGGSASGQKGPAAAPSVRPSYGLKDLLWLVGDRPDRSILDIGPAWQATLDFFLGRGFRFSVEDLFREWRKFQDALEAVTGSHKKEAEESPPDPAAQAGYFLEEELQYGEESLDAVLLWDFLDYSNDALAHVLASRLLRILRPGGCVLAIFHSKPPGSFHRYRIASEGIEVVAAPSLFAESRAFQNREVLNLFGQFRSAKTYVGRDQIREGLFVK